MGMFSKRTVDFNKGKDFLSVTPFVLKMLFLITGVQQEDKYIIYSYDDKVQI